MPATVFSERNLKNFFTGTGVRKVIRILLASEIACRKWSMFCLNLLKLLLFYVVVSNAALESHLTNVVPLQEMETEAGVDLKKDVVPKAETVGNELS